MEGDVMEVAEAVGALEVAVHAVLDDPVVQERLVVHDGNGWLIAIGARPGWRTVSGHTGIETMPDDAVALAYGLVADLKKQVAREANEQALRVESDNLALGGNNRPDAGDGDGGSLSGSAGPLVDERQADDAGPGEGHEPDSGDADGGGGAGDGTAEGEILYADEQPYEPPPSYDPPVVEHEPAAEEDLTPGSPSVAIFGDDLPTNRLIRIGQIDEVEAELLTQLQEGWTVEEFASLQNLIQRIGRGEASDDPEARARFNAISERSQQMSRVQSFARDRKAAVRIGDREFVEGFNPESGWPQF